MATVKPKRGTEMAAIDCCMIIATTKETIPRSVAVNSITKVGVEVQIETTNAVKHIIKNVMKAQKPEASTVTGHKITLTDNLVIMELIEILQGGQVTKDATGKITGYIPPASGAEYNPVAFVLDVYAAQMSGAEIIGYEKTSYPGCKGSPIGLNSEDNVFRVTDYVVNSSPGNGEPPYKIEYVDRLPEADATTLVPPAQI